LSVFDDFYRIKINIKKQIYLKEILSDELALSLIIVIDSIDHAIVVKHLLALSHAPDSPDLAAVAEEVARDVRVTRVVEHGHEGVDPGPNAVSVRVSQGFAVLFVELEHADLVGITRDGLQVPEDEAADETGVVAQIVGVLIVLDFDVAGSEEELCEKEGNKCAPE